MPTPEERITELTTEKANVEAQFNEAARVQEVCKQRYAEIKGALNVLTEMTSEENE